MVITSFFTNNSNPATGLTPSLDIWKIDGTHVVNSQVMSEVGGGFYYYDFTTYNGSEDYCIRADGGAFLSNGERYVYGGNEMASVWDEINEHHTKDGSFGQFLTNLQGNILTFGTAVGGGNGYNQIQLDGASSSDNLYDPGMIVLVGGTGAGQSRGILEYNGTTKTVIINKNWRIQPDNTTRYVIFGDIGHSHVNEGAVRSITSTTVQLNSLASNVDDVYKYQNIFISSGPGNDQIRLIVEYDGATRTATIQRPWDVLPVNGESGYVIIPKAAELLDEDINDHQLVNTIGEAIANTLEYAFTSRNSHIGKWEINNNQLTMYDLNDNILQKFNLYDKNGNPTEENIFKRERVI